MRNRWRSGLERIINLYSLRTQLLYRSLLVIAILLVIVGMLQYIFMREVVYQNKAASLQSHAMSIPGFVWKRVGQYHRQLEQSGQRVPEPSMPMLLMSDTHVAFIDQAGGYHSLPNGQGELATVQLNAEEYEKARRAPLGNPSYHIANDSNGKEQLVVLHPVLSAPGREIGTVQISAPTAPLNDLLMGQTLTFLMIAAIAMLLGVIVLLPVIRRTLRPLSAMVNTAEQIDAGNLDRRFSTAQGQSEVDRLADSFNSMLERLETSFDAEREMKEQMRRFVADASHELRTPLTSIHGFLEVLLRGAAQHPEQLHKALTSMHSESERLSKLIHDLLLLAKLDRDGVPSIELVEGSLDGVIRSMEPQLVMLAGKRTVAITLEPQLLCKQDPDKMKQVVLNLVHNAVQHTDEELGHIHVEGIKNENGVQLSVSDNGLGIAPEHLPYLFDRFYRSETSRNRKSGGSGLGLAITKSIVEAHGGTIDVVSRIGEGSTFRIWLPR
ncbi:ATP-binding protein [Paenibacillus sp. chi10]|uniref:histidine kinase n=1 Tax=Paenibacillus suaedae TaxID=3077233 RepID=A0AAJ2N4W3_9BACL|nr:ATP-binding protein [Paenibacillus sp. chi10]MDT8978057.1 ATP-binding protein [Paenibacillus sp. chi10]